MTTYRKIVLADGQFYHVYNRGVERRTVFTNNWEFKRALNILKYYRFANLPIRFSYLLKLAEDERVKILQDLNRTNNKSVEIIAYCLMPNHFHFLLKQLQANGISRFVSNYTNSYTKYFNTKHERVGPLFEGIFKAVLVETDEQLIHLSRYIHLNPVVAFIVRDFEDYPWSSLQEYLNPNFESICDKDAVLNFFGSKSVYKKFLLDQIVYAKELEKIKHLILE